MIQKIFISYRRENGLQTAQMLYNELTHSGHTVFQDLEKLDNGTYWPQIEKSLAESSVYVLLMTRGAMERTSRDGDSLAREIRMALSRRGELNIVPVSVDGAYMRDEDWPADLPEDIRPIRAITFAELTYGTFFNDSLKKLTKRIETPLSASEPTEPLPCKIAWWVMMAALAVAIIWSAAYALRWRQGAQFYSLRAATSAFLTIDATVMMWALQKVRRRFAIGLTTIVANVIVLISFALGTKPFIFKSNFQLLRKSCIFPWSTIVSAMVLGVIFAIGVEYYKRSQQPLAQDFRDLKRDIVAIALICLTLGWLTYLMTI